jgi:hypothetical protein
VSAFPTRSAETVSGFRAGESLHQLIAAAITVIRWRLPSSTTPTDDDMSMPMSLRCMPTKTKLPGASWGAGP